MSNPEPTRKTLFASDGITAGRAVLKAEVIHYMAQLRYANNPSHLTQLRLTKKLNLLRTARAGATEAAVALAREELRQRYEATKDYRTNP